jgi:hypothetical protein
MVVCNLIILTLGGLLLCGATGYLVDTGSFTPKYQLVYDGGLDRQYCVPTDEVVRALDIPFGLVANKLRAVSIGLSIHGCPN